MKWPQLRLSQSLAQVVRGITFSQGDASAQQTPDSVAVLRAGNIQEQLITDADLVWVPSKFVSAEQHLRVNDIVVCTSSGSATLVGKSAILDHDFVGTWGAFNTVIRCNPDFLLPQYLSYWLRSAMFDAWKTRHVRGANIQNIRQSELESLVIPLPPVPEQQRIVEILKQADALRRQRREILDQAKQLPAALFMEMFGDPRSHAQRWKKVSLSKLVEVRSSLKTPTPEEYGPWPCIGPDSIETGTGRIISMPTVQDVLPESGKYQFEAGDVLYSKIRPNLAKVALAEVAGFCSADMYALVCGSDVRPTFLQYLLLSKSFTQFALSYSGRAQMPKLNREQLLAYRAVVPPLDLQSKFEDIVGSLRNIFKQTEISAREIDQLVSTISVEAFSGQLTASWRETHHGELDKWRRDNVEKLPKKPPRVSFKEFAPPERTPASSSRRYEVLNQLSDFQGFIRDALREWKGTLIPTEHLREFMGQWPVEHLEDVHDQALRALDQIAGLGIIARVSVPNQQGEYVTGYRMLRDDELTKFSDLQRLGAPA